MTKCCINGCNSNSCKNEEGLSFFSFPKNKGLQKLWINNIGQGNIKPVVVRRICSLHFEKECINRTLDVVRLKDDVVPTLFPFTTSSSVQSRVKQTSSVNTALKVVQLNDNVVPALFPHIPIDIDAPIYTERVQPTNKVDLSENTGDMSMVFADKTAVKMQELQKQVLLQRKKIKLLNQKCRRLKQKVHTYKNIIDELKKQNFVPHEGAILLEE
ncbi:unnamed protein product [Parnassius mnemosyne]|uniref:THAP-type domain-containing protein n=1 Tax=Parnassius mnemosyne TaxID=213953 RepID=A0AAV1LAK8_9NEOP